MKKPRNPSIKYSPELAKIICDAIEETGRDIDGIAAGQITKMTFYRWMKDKPHFKAAVEAARETYKSTALPQLRKYARGGLRRTLQAIYEGREIVTTTTVSGVGLMVRLIWKQSNENPPWSRSPRRLNSSWAKKFT